MALGIWGPKWGGRSSGPGDSERRNSFLASFHLLTLSHLVFSFFLDVSFFFPSPSASLSS